MALFNRRTSEAEMAQEITQLRSQVEHLTESAETAQLELMADDVGWLRLLAEHEREFTHEGRQRIRELCRMVAIANPFGKRGVNLRAAYVWGPGVTISARATGERTTRSGEPIVEQDLNTIVQEFLDDPSNVAACTGPQAREEAERALATDGELFLAHPTDPVTGRVQVRQIVADEIADIICNPEDASEPWYYVRQWTQAAVRLNGTEQTTAYRVAYPALGYRPLQRPRSMDGVEIRWNQPVLHVKVNGLTGWRHGVPDLYASLQWLRAYSGFLGDWVRLHKALSEFAWRYSSKGSKAQTARAKLAGARTGAEATPDGRLVGATALLPTDATLEAVPKTGATIDADSGRPIAAAIAAGLDVPITALTTDPGITGARATAETLDKPTELVMTMRRNVWAQAIRDQLAYVIAQAVRAHKLKGNITKVAGREVVVLADDTDPTIVVTFPDLTQTPIDLIVKAITEADATGKMPPEETLRLLLGAFGVEDADEVIKSMRDENGQFKAPDIEAGMRALLRAGDGETDPVEPVDDPTA